MLPVTEWSLKAIVLQFMLCLNKSTHDCLAYFNFCPYYSKWEMFAILSLSVRVMPTYSDMISKINYILQLNIYYTSCTLQCKLDYLASLQITIINFPV